MDYFFISHYSQATRRIIASAERCPGPAAQVATGAKKRAIGFYLHALRPAVYHLRGKRTDQHLPSGFSRTKCWMHMYSYRTPGKYTTT